MCLPEKSKAKEVVAKRQQELLQVIEDTRNRMEAEVVLAANSVFCVWPGICLTHPVADFANNNNNNNNVNQRNNNVQPPRNRSRSHQRYDTQRHSAGTLSRQRSHQATAVYGRSTNTVQQQAPQVERATVGTQFDAVNADADVVVEEPTHNEPGLDTVGTRVNLFSHFQDLQQLHQYTVPNQLNAAYPILQSQNEVLSNSFNMPTEGRTNDPLFGGVLPLLNIFQFFRNS